MEPASNAALCSLRKFPEGNEECRLFLPVTVVGVFVVAAQSCQAPLADGVREEDLSACIQPDLEQRRSVVSRPGNKINKWLCPVNNNSSSHGEQTL